MTFVLSFPNEEPASMVIPVNSPAWSFHRCEAFERPPPKRRLTSSSINDMVDRLMPYYQRAADRTKRTALGLIYHQNHTTATTGIEEVGALLSIEVPDHEAFTSWLNESRGVRYGCDNLKLLLLWFVLNDQTTLRAVLNNDEKMQFDILQLMGFVPKRDEFVIH
eukprot:TRINITY_DN3325_c0_g1_i1.p1 TRINITY_DN3325_c0_g1~~TRINITY_DN3325_c0_g1_i1.p1  ORF type:complete len:164 (+),score=29.37 TRINITY_DN3325_c0_g1_i1:406-897(+)